MIKLGVTRLVITIICTKPQRVVFLFFYYYLHCFIYLCAIFVDIFKIETRTESLCRAPLVNKNKLQIKLQITALIIVNDDLI